MQVVHPSEMAGRNFYFDHGDLVVNRAVLPEKYPSVLVPEEFESAGFQTVSFEGIELDSAVALVSPEGQLACRKEEDYVRATKMLGIAIGHSLTANRAEARSVEQQVGAGHSLLALLRNHPTEDIYLHYFDATFHTNFRPTTEPRHLAVAA